MRHGTEPHSVPRSGARVKASQMRSSRRCWSPGSPRWSSQPHSAERSASTRASRLPVAVWHPSSAGSLLTSTGDGHSSAWRSWQPLLAAAPPPGEPRVDAAPPEFRAAPHPTNVDLRWRRVLRSRWPDRHRRPGRRRGARRVGPVRRRSRPVAALRTPCRDDHWPVLGSAARQLGAIGGAAWLPPPPQRRSAGSSPWAPHPSRSP